MTVGELRDSIERIESSRLSIDFGGLWLRPCPIQEIEHTPSKSLVLTLAPWSMIGMTTKEVQKALEEVEGDTSVFIRMEGETYRNLELIESSDTPHIIHESSDNSHIIHIVKSSMTVGELKEALKNCDEDNFIIYGNEELVGFEVSNGRVRLEFRD